MLTHDNASIVLIGSTGASNKETPFHYVNATSPVFEFQHAYEALAQAVHRISSAQIISLACFFGGYMDDALFICRTMS